MVIVGVLTIARHQLCQVTLNCIYYYDHYHFFFEVVDASHASKVLIDVWNHLFVNSRSRFMTWCLCISQCGGSYYQYMYWGQGTCRWDQKGDAGLASRIQNRLRFLAQLSFETLFTPQSYLYSRTCKSRRFSLFAISRKLPNATIRKRQESRSDGWGHSYSGGLCSTV